MKIKNKTISHKSRKIDCSFTGNKLTGYSGLTSVMRYMNKLRIGQSLNKLFPTIQYNSTKYSDSQVLTVVILASLAGINRMSRIANFTHDILVKSLLVLPTGLNKDVISTRLKGLGQAGSIYLHEYMLATMTKWITKSRLESITLDADSTVQSVYGNQEGAAKGFNSSKRGAKSYHNLLCFASELKFVLNSWFRTGSSYTSNGICDFLSQTKAILPSNIQTVFFRADSGFFNGRMFDLLETYKWYYLVKVKLRNLKTLLQMQQWEPVIGVKDVAVCEFDHKCKGWKKSRRLKAIRTVKEYVPVDILGMIEYEPVYQYACYCSNLELDAVGLHENYTERSTSETWIEQIKTQLKSGQTRTNSFHANDILWQLGVFAYNLSIMMRLKVKSLWREEHKTFQDWFITVAGQLVKSGRKITVKIYEHYYERERWLEVQDHLISL